MTDILDPYLPESKLASKRTRVFAALIDLVLTGIVTALILTSFGQRYQTDNGGVGYQLTGPLALLPELFWFLAVPLLEGIKGQSLGKMIFKIEVVAKDLHKASLGQTIVRHLFDIVDWLPGFGIVGLLVASNTKDSQRVGDLVAKTVVIQKQLPINK